MSATLLAAINDAWNGNAALASTVTLFNDEPPEGTAFPYAVITQFREDNHRDCFEGGRNYDGRCTIEFRAIGTAITEGYLTQAKTVLETDGALAIDNHGILDTRIERSAVELDKTRSTDARRVTNGSLDLFVWSHG